MKKKFLSLVFAFCLISAAIFGLTACKDGENPPAANTYLVQFYNHDGSLIKETNVEENSVATCATPTKDSTQYYIYEFSHWAFLDGTDATEDLTNVTQNLTVKAVFIEVQPAYTINFYDEDRQTVIETISVLRGENGTLPENPTKDSDEFYDYSFVAWEDASGAVVETLTSVSANLNLYATYEVSNQHTFAVNFYDDDKSTLLYSQVIKQGDDATCELDLMKDLLGTNFAYCFDCWTDIEGNEISLSNVQVPTNFYAKYSKNVFDKVNKVRYGISSDETCYFVSNSDKTLTEVTIVGEINSIPVEAIADQAFAGSKITNIVLPSQLKTIGYKAFEGSRISSLTIPGTLETIGEMAFSYCRDLRMLVIEEGVETIERGTFVDCDSLMYVSLPNDLEEIPIGMFSGCSSLATITIPSSVKKIGIGAFEKTGLQVVQIPDSVTEISSYAFQYCNSLVSVTFGQNVKTIGSEAFEGINSSCVINYNGNVNDWVLISFNDYYSNPLASGAVLKVAGEIVTNIIIDEAISISNNAFGAYTYANFVTIGESVELIGKDAFKNCEFEIVTIDSKTMANVLADHLSCGSLIKNTETVKIKSGLNVTNSTYLLENFTKQETIDGYDVYVRNVTES